MIDLGLSKMALIGVVALVVIGPERLPKVARTVGTLLGRAQRYIADVRSEVSRQIELDEIKKVKSDMTSAAKSLEKDFNTQARDAHSEFDSAWNEAKEAVDQARSDSGIKIPKEEPQPMPVLDYPSKRRKPQSSVPLWYRRQKRMRSSATSGAARVMRYRPKSR